MRGQALFGVAVWAATACADDPAANADAQGATTTLGSDAGTTSPATDDATQAPDTGTLDNGSTSTGEDTMAALPYAADIRLTRITANQGVQVTLVDAGQQVPGTDYNTRIIVGRRMLLRGFWSLHANFEPRELIGRLTVDYEDDTQLVQEFSVVVDGDSGDGGASMQWLLEPDQVRPGMKFRAQLLEPDPDYQGGAVADPPPIAPLSGRGTIDVYDAALQMRVIVVPVQHEFEGCTMSIEPTDEDLQVMGEQLEQSNPIQRAEIVLGSPLVYTDPIGTSTEGFSGILAALAQYRAARTPDDNVYLYGLIDPCDGFPGGLLGQAIGIPGSPLPELANQRISAGRWLGTGLATSETFVHEVGHSQGRRHVFCSGGEAGIDPAYPHAGGRIGVWGFGIYDFQLRTPAGARDYMTYCSNEWVSDYAWEQTLEIIETLTSWDAQDAPPAPHGTLLMGMVVPGGRTRWWTTRGDLDPTLLPSPHQLRLTTGDEVVWVDATTQLQPEGTATTIAARLPPDWHAADAMQLAGPQFSIPIAPQAIVRTARDD